MIDTKRDNLSFCIEVVDTSLRLALSSSRTRGVGFGLAHFNLVQIVSGRILLVVVYYRKHIGFKCFL